MNSMKHLLVVSVAAVASALTGAEIDGNEWQDQTRLSLGKEAPRAAFFTYPDEETARKSFWGEAKPWKELAWEDTQTGAMTIPMEAYDGMKPEGGDLTVTIEPHTVQSVTVQLGNAPKK